MDVMVNAKAHLVIFALILAAYPAFAQTPKPADPWAPIAFLLGEWTGEGSGQPGQGSGGFSFQPDLEQKIVVRKNFANYPATKDRPAYAHSDLMIVYKDPAGGRLRAIYFDNEEHVIDYTLEPSPDASSVRFVSKTYRLTYRKTGPDTLAVKFEIAPPDQPGAFKTYIEATARRK